jgi:GNAT superfamily N-acetyltransferase
VAPTLEELAEHTEVHLLPRATYELVERPGFVYIAGPRAANVHPYRLEEVPAAVAWSRDESRRRGHKEIGWWVGWRSEPAPIGDQLLGCGLVRDPDAPTLTGMTCTEATPTEPSVEIQRVENFEDYVAALQVDWRVWKLTEKEIAERQEIEVRRYDAIAAMGNVHHFSALLDGVRVGFGRAIDMDGAVALFGGSVLPEARGRGVYRALVRARWEHAVARDTPTLVVQAGSMSAPVLAGLGFAAHGEIELYIDRL